MKEKYRDKRRERHYYIKDIGSFYILPPFLGILSTLIMLPAFFYGCKTADRAPVPLQAARAPESHSANEASGIRTLDIFVFNNDIFQKLDCYQRFDDMELWNGAVISGSGNRIISILANSPYGREEWFRINTRAYLKDVVLRLEDESREHLFMSGEKTADTDGYALPAKEELHLEPFASEIFLNSISCDFSGKPYAGERLSEVRVYLTNVNAECRILDEDNAAPTRIINAGRLHEEDMEGFTQPDIIMQEIDEDIGPEAVHPDIRLLCYRNGSFRETPGTPYTRLVIEGKVSGRTYYWPININRDTGVEPGVWRNRRYVYDVMITGKGSSDPDTPVTTNESVINQKVTEWKEMKEYRVSF